MRVFTDCKGREWKLALDLGAVRRVKDATGFDFLQVIEDPKVLASLGDDFPLLATVLYVLAKGQDGIIEQDFAEGLNGDVLDDAASKLIQETVDFFPKHRRGPLAKAVEKLDQYRAKFAEMAMMRMDSPELERQVESVLLKALESPLPNSGGTFGESPASSE